LNVHHSGLWVDVSPLEMAAAVSGTPDQALKSEFMPGDGSVDHMVL
jgi:hypothetical protein